MICKSCGNNVKSDFKFCPYCGGRVAGDFHDHYGDLTPPYIMEGEEDQPDSNADFYAGTLDEPIPNFQSARWNLPEDVQDFGSAEGKEPYFVYRPGRTAATKNPAEKVAQEKSKKAAKPKKEKATPSLALKIILIIVTLLLAFGAAYGIYLGVQMFGNDSFAVMFGTMVTNLCGQMISL